MSNQTVSDILYEVGRDTNITHLVSEQSGILDRWSGPHSAHQASQTDSS